MLRLEEGKKGRREEGKGDGTGALHAYRFEGADDWEKTRYNLGFYHESNNLCLYSCKCLQHEKKKRIDHYRRINHLVIFLVYLM
jgi:hypothetical protein